MKDEFDKSVRDLISSKKYDFSDALWTKAKIGVKAAYTKIILVKSAIVLGSTTAITALSVVVYNTLPPQPVEVNNITLPSEHQTSEAPMITDRPASVEWPSSISKSTDTNGANLSKPLQNIEKAVELSRTEQPIPQDPLVESSRVVEQPPTSELPKESTIGPSAEIISDPNPIKNYTPIQTNVNPLGQNFDLNVIPVLLPIPSTPLAKYSPEWSVALSLEQGQSSIEDNLPDGGAQVLGSSYQSIGLEASKRVLGNWTAGAGIRTQTYEETRKYSSLFPQRIIERFEPWKFDTSGIGPFMVFNPNTGQWEKVDTSFFFDPTLFGTHTSDTLWANRTEIVTNQINSIEIPIQLGYEFEVGRWVLSPSISAGVGFIYGVQYSRYNGPSAETSPLTTADFKTLYLNYRAEANIQYRFTLRNFVSAGVGYKQGLSTLGSNQVQTKSGSRYYKLGVGFRF